MWVGKYKSKTKKLIKLKKKNQDAQLVMARAERM